MCVCVCVCVCVWWYDLDSVRLFFFVGGQQVVLLAKNTCNIHFDREVLSGFISCGSSQAYRTQEPDSFSLYLKVEGGCLRFYRRSLSIYLHLTHFLNC